MTAPAKLPMLPPCPEPLRVLSLGAGVQSSTLALMVAHGEVAPVDVAIFADTGAEPQAVYDWLAWLTARLPFEVVRVMQDDGLTRHIERATEGKRFAGIPAFTESASGGGKLRRQCTREFKIQPITREVRRRLGFGPGQRIPNRHLVTQLIGISLDEVIRMKPVRLRYVETEWPLIDKRMTRADCLEWMRSHDYPVPPRSACVYCPFKSRSEWRALRASDPAGWAEAVRIDGLIRGGVRGTHERLFLHRDMVPLEAADNDSAEDKGQKRLWGEECEGLCGV